MPTIQAEVKQIIIREIKKAGYAFRVNMYVPGKEYDHILPIAILDQAGQPCQVIRIRIRSEKNRKYKETPSKRLQAWQKLSKREVITIWSRSDAENIASTLAKVFSS